MLLGKRPRPRPPMKRTTSFSEISFDLNGGGDAPVAVAAVDPNNRGEGGGVAGISSPWKQTDGDWLNNNNTNGFHQNEGAVSLLPRNNRRHSANYLETADFLRSCGFCKRRLVASRDIYMYRGDTAFCSLECRQQQMNQDERKDKRCVGVGVASKKQVLATAGASGSQVTTTKGETVAAL
ncbi:hypothetical protein L6164_030561 [Bauhinia variegata]|uniref:Uncharacterized protein n=1 Tax=Bauhinia variegata TaxID=167791 RepID=A0ACB9LC53_BAUVA|nr:hypothetical protein L6164_030561 [Bauhinia variegata]